ncbi:MAG: hypothetical protein R2881_01460 [Eubacteriales bacterium]
MDALWYRAKVAENRARRRAEIRPWRQAAAMPKGDARIKRMQFLGKVNAARREKRARHRVAKVRIGPHRADVKRTGEFRGKR